MLCVSILSILHVAHPSFSSTIHVDCITVSTLPVKSAIDDQIQQLFDALLNSLRHSISQHLQVSLTHTPNNNNYPTHTQLSSAAVNRYLPE